MKSAFSRSLVLLGAALIGSACVTTSTDTKTTPPGGVADPGDCITVDMAVSPEKVTLLGELATTFNKSDAAKVNGKCVFVRPARKASGGAAQLLAAGWPDPAANGPQPVIWSPSASAWGAIVNERVGKQLAPAGTPFMFTPLVIAMPKPMADALGYPATPIGFADIVALGQQSGRVGSVWPPRMGRLQAWQDQPQLFHQRTELHRSPSTTPPPARPRV